MIQGVQRALETIILTGVGWRRILVQYATRNIQRTDDIASAVSASGQPFSAFLHLSPIVLVLGQLGVVPSWEDPADADGDEVPARGVQQMVQRPVDAMCIGDELS
jgi:hypothetical protein